jgi:hypothetical protein
MHFTSFKMLYLELFLIKNITIYIEFLCLFLMFSIFIYYYNDDILIVISNF